jgi:small subunit ribosomal protein S1
MKQLLDDPWQGIEAKFPVGTKFKGRVTNITDYGAFVELEPGIEGLIHVSEMSWTKKNVHPGKIVSTSQEVEVMVLDVDPQKRRISLGLKQCLGNPWENFAAQHPSGTVVEGEIKNITEFGLFIGLSGEIDGMVHLSDIDWNRSGEEAIAEFKKGDTVTCTVSAVLDNGIEVKVNDTLHGFIRKTDLSADRSEQRPDRFAPGEKVDAKVTAVDKSNRKLNLSIKAREVQEEKEAMAEYGSSDSGASLGDILGAALRSKQQEERQKSDGDEEGEKKS